MTQDEIIEMARQAGYLDLSLTDRGMELKELEAFAKLVAAKEREACAKVADEWGLNNITATAIAFEIRARGQA